MSHDTVLRGREPVREEHWCGVGLKIGALWIIYYGIKVLNLQYQKVTIGRQHAALGLTDHHSADRPDSVSEHYCHYHYRPPLHVAVPFRPPNASQDQTHKLGIRGKLFS